MLSSKFQVNWPFGSGEEVKNIFSRWGHGGNLGFPIRSILATFDVQVALMLPTKFRVNLSRGVGGDHNSSPWGMGTHSRAVTFKVSKAYSF